MSEYKEDGPLTKQVLSQGLLVIVDARFLRDLLVGLMYHLFQAPAMVLFLAHPKTQRRKEE